MNQPATVLPHEEDLFFSGGLGTGAAEAGTSGRHSAGSGGGAGSTAAGAHGDSKQSGGAPELGPGSHELDCHPIRDFEEEDGGAAEAEKRELRIYAIPLYKVRWAPNFLDGSHGAAHADATCAALPTTCRCDVAHDNMIKHGTLGSGLGSWFLMAAMG